MRPAKNLKDLLRIRAHSQNREYLDSINGNLGSALGFKKRTDEDMSNEPAIIVFVPEKINRKWILNEELIRDRLEINTGADRVFCPLDVVAGKRPKVQPELPTESGSALAQRMRGWDDHIWCGSQIQSFSGEIGTIGPFVRRGTGANKQIGFITARHVVFNKDSRTTNLVLHPKVGTTLIGEPLQHEFEEDASTWYEGVAEFPSFASVQVDYAFVKLFDGVVKHVIPSAPVSAPKKPKEFGSVFEIDLTADMVQEPDSCPVGQNVIHVGRTSGRREGTIHGFAYEWIDESERKRYADLLIAPQLANVDDEGNVQLSIGFSDRGDSGSVVFTKNGNHPIALLWGGRIEQLRGGDSQENWTYATRLDNIMSRLSAKLVTKESQLT